MSFGDILDEWERNQQKRKVSPNPKDEFRRMMDGWLDSEGVAKKEADLRGHSRKSPSRKTIRRMAPQESIDLHGYTVDEALLELEAFLKRSKKRGLKKVLVIHGKGHHSADGESILRRRVRAYLASSPFCGETGVPQPSLGGEGAVWVILR